MEELRATGKGSRTAGSRRRRHEIRLTGDQWMATVLYVDDEPSMREAVSTWLKAKGIEVDTATNVASGKMAFQRRRYDGAFIDIWLGDGSGFELFAWLEENQPAATRNVLFVTGDVVSAPAVKEITKLGKPTIAKPFDLEELEKYVKKWAKK
jgi:two-component system, OmpR family, response regulator